MAKTKQTSDTTSASTAVTHTDVPDWIRNPTMTVAGQVQDIVNKGPGAYTPEISGLQQGAFDRAATLGEGPDYFGQARDAIGGIKDVGGESVLSGLSQYENPYRQQVLNPVLNDYDYQAGVRRADQAAQAAANHAFQGSRFGIREAQTEGELARGRAAAEGGLLNQMYTQAAGMSEADAARRQQAAMANQGMQAQRAQMLAGLGTSVGAEDRANLGLTADLGATATGLGNEIRNAPMTYAGQAEGLLGGLDPNNIYGDKTISSTGTEHTVGTGKNKPGLLDLAGTAAQIGSTLAMSDRALKTAIRTLFHDARGRRWVEFAYRWAPWTKHIGVIAQEVLKTDPAAVSIMPNGYLAVDYGRL